MGELVLLPGMICDEGIWRPQIRALSPAWTCSVASYPLLDSIGAMAESVLAKAAPRFAVAGHSMGGRVALEIYARAPARVLGIALLGTDFRAPRDQQEREKDAAVIRGALQEIVREGYSGFAQAWARRLIAAKRREDLDLIADIVAMTMHFGPASIEAHGRAGLTRPDYTALLAKIDCPALICAGDEDLARPVGPHRMMAEAIRNSTLMVLEECGHMMTLECPLAVSAAMDDWLSRLN